MKKLLYITFAFVGFFGFTFAQVDSMHVAPATQSAISGSMVTFTVTGYNGTGDAYLKYALPKTANYDVAYQNATQTPINNLVLSMGAEHDPIFLIPAQTTFSVTITAKLITSNWTFSPITTQAIFANSSAFTTLLGAVNAIVAPIADITITNILTGEYPSTSGDIVSYNITLQNIGSTSATGITFASTFPLPTLGIPTARFNGTPHIYSTISYPADFVWSGTYLNTLNPGQTITILVTAPLTQNIAVGTTFNQTAKVATISPEFATGNNSALASGIVQALPDLWVRTVLAPFTGYRAGDIVSATINYGNSGGKVANNVTLTHVVSGSVQLATPSTTLGTLPPGSGGSLLVTGILQSNLSSGNIFTITSSLRTTTPETITGNNTFLATGIIQGLAGPTTTITINNITRPQLDNLPYGSGPSLMIQAYSGDMIQIVIEYGNSGNVILTSGSLSLSGLNGIGGLLPSYIYPLGNLAIDQTGSIVLTGIVGPTNYISKTISATLSSTSTTPNTFSVRIVEPMLCGDGILSRTEQCDTQGNLGVLYSGQICENQQGQCVLRTNAIVNMACVRYQYANPLGGNITGESCSSTNTALTPSQCVSLTGSTPQANNNGFEINYTCRGTTTNTTTPITIDCGNGTQITGIGNLLNGTCRYTGGFVGNAQCNVGNDVNNPICRRPVNETSLQCDLEARDGRIIVINDNGRGDARFRCETRNFVPAQTLSIDCGSGNIGGNTTVNNASQVETTCRYSETTTPQNKTVTCSTNNIVCESEPIILDQGIFGRCGDGIVQGYEECDVLNMAPNQSYPLANGQSCMNCRIVGNEAPVACFNVGGNNNLSIQVGEILPFRFAIDKKTNFVSSCTSANTNKVRKASLQCSFAIYNGMGATVKTISLPCGNNSRAGSPIFDHILSIGKQRYSLQNAFGKFYTTLSQGDIGNTYGEYKLRLDQVNYEYCDGTQWRQGTPVDRVCDVNFTVTQPYIAQKSLFATTPKATDIRLAGYKTINGEDLIKSTDLNEIMVLDATAYESKTTVANLINDFITKYDKLAVTVPESSLKNTAFEGKNVTVKIVPSQKIYILESSTRKTVTLENIKSFTAPFTIVTKNIDLVIQGNVDYNGMFLVKGGTIGFAQSSTTTTDRCPAPQTIKGIFITDQGFAATTPALRNNNINNKRCSYGNLHVKGILIGNNIQDLVNSRRSQLNTWFSVKSSAEAAIKSERRNKIFDGAAVLIEYSPSLWNALPPGASEFTKVLEVYKK